MRRVKIERFDEIADLVFELRGESHRPFGAHVGGNARFVQLAQETKLRGFTEREQVFPEQILVFGQETVGVVRDVASVVTDDEMELLRLGFGTLRDGKV